MFFVKNISISTNNIANIGQRSSLLEPPFPII